jgi:outer membrane murein-binding lipoprotein Lpp
MGTHGTKTNSYRTGVVAVNRRTAKLRLKTPSKLNVSFTNLSPYSARSFANSRFEAVRQFNKTSRRNATTPILVALAAAWMLSGCSAAALIPEAARQVKDIIKSAQPELPSDQRLIAEADMALAAGDVATAEAYLDATLSGNPYHKDALSRLAEIYRLTDRSEMALEIDHLDPGIIASSYVPEGVEFVAYDAESKIIERFATLARLLNTELISPEEYALRRSANLGALLPLTQPPPALATDQPAPLANDMISRLEAIAQFYMIGALDAEAYKAERSGILAGLMPLPTDADEAPEIARTIDPEFHQIRLERLLTAELISRGEYDSESAALLSLFTPAAAPANIMAEQMAALENPVIPRQETDPDMGAMENRERPALGPEITTRVDVHLALTRTPERAQRNWEDLHQAHSDVLDGLEPRIARIDLGDERGIYFQLSAGPLADIEAAEALCNTLVRRRLYCAPMIF